MFCLMGLGMAHCNLK
uniref:Uncharacterized protein n=1 Tax=Anguilla anguilla TaxID=7936 RepID=A0A0E9U393_ANGAN